MMDLYDIPDYEHTEDEAFPPMPPPFSPGPGGEDGDPFGNGDEDGEISKLAEVPAAKKRGVKRPQPKLDSQRLTSEKGLPALRTLFDNVQFKGKGHEAEDLRVLMQRMENWAHRLYPKLQFDAFIDKLETLGGKKEVQTCLKRIRLDMPLTHEDFIGKDGEEDEVVPRENPFHEDPDPFGDAGFPEEPPGLVHSTPAPPALTEEQRRRIELNKQLALEKRLARLQQPSDSSQPVSSSMLAEEPSTSSSSHFLSQQNNPGVDEDEDDEMELDQGKSGADDDDLELDQGKSRADDDDDLELDQGKSRADDDDLELDQGKSRADDDDLELDQGKSRADDDDLEIDQGKSRADDDDLEIDQGKSRADDDDLEIDQGKSGADDPNNKPGHKGSSQPAESGEGSHSPAPEPINGCEDSD